MLLRSTGTGKKEAARRSRVKKAQVRNAVTLSAPKKGSRGGLPRVTLPVCCTAAFYYMVPAPRRPPAPRNQGPGNADSITCVYAECEHDNGNCAGRRAHTCGACMAYAPSTGFVASGEGANAKGMDGQRMGTHLASCPKGPHHHSRNPTGLCRCARCSSPKCTSDMGPYCGGRH